MTEMGNPVELIKIKEVCAITKMSRPTVYRRLKNTTFPKPRKSIASSGRGPRTVNKWSKHEVHAWLAAGNEPSWTAQEKSVFTKLQEYYDVYWVGIVVTCCALLGTILGLLATG